MTDPKGVGSFSLFADHPDGPPSVYHLGDFWADAPDLPEEVRIANRDLMAAAPELLAACKAVMSFVEPAEICKLHGTSIKGQLHMDPVGLMRAAIAKAEGGKEEQSCQ
jgi:hypothetical protein